LATRLRPDHRSIDLAVPGTGRRRTDASPRPARISLAETIIGLYKTELISRQGPWRGLEDVELATLTYIDWFNRRRILEPIGDIPPAEYEANHYRQKSPAVTAGLK
jgi:putative transposase